MDFSTWQRVLLGIACVVAWAVGPDAMAANCTFVYSDKYNKEVTLNFGAGLTADSLTIPQDAPLALSFISKALTQQSMSSRVRQQHDTDSP